MPRLPKLRATCQAFVGLAILLFAASPAATQQVMKVKLERVEVGFHNQSGEQAGGLFLPGLWTPVFVTLSSGGDGDLRLPARPDGTCHGQLLVEDTDGDGGQNVYASSFVLPDKGRITVVAYTMPGSTTPDLGLTLTSDEQADRRIRLANETFPGLGLHQHLYLTLGARLKDVRSALLELAGNRQDGETAPRHAGAETEVARMPDHWFGYQAVDLVVLTTNNDRFLADLERSPAKVQALAGWVARGGRLLVSISWRNQDRVRKLLSGPGWPPALAAVVPADRQVRLPSLAGLLTWANILNKPFPVSRQKPLPVPVLEPGKDAEVFFREEAGAPLLVRLPHGRGSIALLAVDLDQAPFTVWQGRVDFWKALLARLAPRVEAGLNGDMDRFQREDVAVRLHRELDNFDVPVISFGWVALFILLYIVVVGPLDYLILKKVFKRLEWTWITFPTVVLLVSVVAYFTAYALKGNDLKVNQVDLVDIDQRTDLDKEGRTRRAHGYGTTWLAVLSPRIQSYTLGIEPVLAPWTGAGSAKASSEGMVTWLGRPEAVGQGGFGRPRSQTLFSRTYHYAPDAVGLRDVPIPVWTTKAFTAAWDVSFSQPPLRADLSYRPADPDQRVAGTIESRLPVSLEDVFLFYGTRAFPLEGGLPGGKDAAVVKVVLDPARALDADRWARSGVQLPMHEQYQFAGGRRSFAPTPVVKELLFEEFAGGANHSFRALDQSWRLHELQVREQGVRDIILVGRLPRAQGPAEELTAAGRLPAQLWLSGQPDELPGEGRTRPTLSGTLIQETYVRVFLPVRPQ